MKYLIPLTFFLLSNLAHSAGMNSQLDNIYNDMENYTAPGSFETMRRSGYTLGRYTYKTPILNENIISITPFSAKGGCSGIDVYGGSFSFINSDQIVQLLRAVASNAQGYAFQLAMDNICSSCMKWMNELQSKVQKMNANLSNSCQLAQGLVNDGYNMFAETEKKKTGASLSATLKGFSEDFGGVSKFITSSDTPQKIVKDANEDEFHLTTGNIVYKALTTQDVKSWYVAGDEELIESIFSITGSIVITDLETNLEDGGDTTNTVILPAGKIKIDDLINGRQAAKIYDCSQSDYPDICRITPNNTKSINIIGLKTKILEAFTGPNGLITYIKQGQINQNFSEEQKAILGAMPHSIGTKIYDLAPQSPEAAEDLINEVIDAIALEYVWRLINSSFDATFVALHAQKTDPNIGNALDVVTKAKAEVTDEYAILKAEYGSSSDINFKFNAAMKPLPKPTYVSPSKNQKGK